MVANKVPVFLWDIVKEKWPTITEDTRAVYVKDGPGFYVVPILEGDERPIWQRWTDPPHTYPTFDQEHIELERLTGLEWCDIVAMGYGPRSDTLVIRRGVHTL